MFAEDCVMSVYDGTDFAITASGTGVVLSSPAAGYSYTWNAMQAGITRPTTGSESAASSESRNTRRRKSRRERSIPKL